MPLSRDDITRLIDIEAQLQNVPTGLARAVAYHESGFDPKIEGDGGNAIGLFQLHKGAAIDAGIDPKDRWDPAKNIFAGVRYLRQKLDQSGGKIDEALSRYNRGTPDYRGIGDPNYVQRVKRYYTSEGVQPSQAQPSQQQSQAPGILARIGQALSPASAEAATPQAPARSRLEEIEAELARREQQAAPVETPPRGSQVAPGSTITPRRDIPPAVPQEAPPAPDTSWTPGMRFQALPSITQLEPGDRAQKTKLFESLNPQMQQEFLRSEEPQAASLAVGGGGAATPKPVTDPAALLAVGGKPTQTPAQVPQAQAPPAQATPASSTRIEPLQPGASELALAEVNRPHEQGIPLSAVPAIAVNTLGTVGGAALGSLLGPVGSAAGAALGGSLATRANTALGLAPQEKPLLETPYANVYPSDLLGAIPLGIATGAAALKGAVRNLPGANVGRHELAAEKLTELGQRMGPPAPSSGLFAEAAAQGGNVPTPTLWREAGKVVREEKGMKKGFVSTEAMQAGGGLMDLMREHGGQVPLAEVEKYRQRLFQKIQTTTDRAELKRLQDLYGAIHEDLALAAQAGTAAGAGTLKAAIAAKRKEHAQETLTDVWSPGKGLQLQEGEHVQVYGKRIRNEVEKRLHQDKLFAGSFTPAEVVDMRNTLREVGKLTRMTNPDAQGAVGSTLKWLGRLGGAGGAGYGIATGDMSTMITGGTMLLATEGATAVLSNAMQSKVGRWALREAIREGNGTLTHGSLAAIAALVAREAAPDAPAPAPTP